MIDKIAALFTKNGIKRLAKYGAVGLTNTAVDYIVFFVLFERFGVNKYAAQLAAVLTAATNSYFLNRNFTFKGANSGGIAGYFKFMGVNLTSIILSLILMRVFSEIPGLNMLAVKIIISGVTMISQFLLYNFWIFKDSVR